MRNPDKTYGFGKRSSDMIKLKERQEETFRIIGFKEGLRPIEDFVFILETKSKKQFEAKPMGTFEVRKEYYENIDDAIGRLADVTFFNWTEDKIPSQPVFKAIRYDL